MILCLIPHFFIVFLIIFLKKLSSSHDSSIFGSVPQKSKVMLGYLTAATGSLENKEVKVQCFCISSQNIWLKEFTTEFTYSERINQF